MSTTTESREFKFDRMLRALNVPRLKAVLDDGGLGDLSWPERWTWLAILTLVAWHQHGLTWATMEGICKVRRELWRVGSSIPQVKRHIWALQAKGFLLRFKEVRPHEPRAKTRLHVTVVLFADKDAFRTARSREARQLVHGWPSGAWNVPVDACFRGPVPHGSSKGRRSVYFADLVALNVEAAGLAAARQRPRGAGDHSAPKVIPRIDIHEGDPREEKENRASAEVCKTAEWGDGASWSDSGDLDDFADLDDIAELSDLDEPVQDVDCTLLGLAAHRRPEGGICGHPRPEGGLGASAVPEAGRDA